MYVHMYVSSFSSSSSSSTYLPTYLPTQAALATPGAVVVEGEMKIGGQEHFYLETNATIAIPGR